MSPPNGNNATNTSEALIESTLLDLVTQRGAGKSICPSEVARAVNPEDWRPLMAEVRTKAKELVLQGKILVTQRGEPVDLDTAKGPVRLTLNNSGTASASLSP